MSVIRRPAPVKLFFSIFAGDGSAVDRAIAELAGKYGPVDIGTPLMRFDQTNYYEKEFGRDLVRKIAVMEKLIMPEDITAVKLYAAEMEQRTMQDNRRTVNIDPGYVELSRMVLTTGKDYAHRIYLRDGVFADLTLVFKKDEGFTTLPWTYPDYASEQYRSFFNDAREKLRKQLKGGEH